MRDPFIIYFFTIFFSAASKPTPPCVDYCPKDGLCLYPSDFCDGTGMCWGKIIIEKLKDNLGILGLSGGLLLIFPKRNYLKLLYKTYTKNVKFTQKM